MPARKSRKFNYSAPISFDNLFPQTILFLRSQFYFFSVFYKTSLIEYFLLFFFYFFLMDNPLLFLIGIAIIKLEIINYDLLSETFSYLTVPHARRVISQCWSFMNDCFNDPLTFR